MTGLFFRPMHRHSLTSLSVTKVRTSLLMVAQVASIGKFAAPVLASPPPSHPPVPHSTSVAGNAGGLARRLRGVHWRAVCGVPYWHTKGECAGRRLQYGQGPHTRKAPCVVLKPLPVSEAI